MVIISGIVYYMAKKIVTTTEYTDDLDGSAAVGTISFAFDGTSFEIDLSKSNAKAFEKSMKVYVDSARKVRASRGKVSSRSKAKEHGKQDLSVIREWAKGAGYEISSRGRIAGEVVEAYQAAH